MSGGAGLPGGFSAPRWRPSTEARRIQVIDSHTGGEPLRVVTGGWPLPPGRSVLERRRHARDHQDALRRALMWEPRGHADMYGCLLVPAEHEDGDFGILFMHNEGFSTMCGHGIIAATTVILETGMWPVTCPVTCPETVLRIDSPAGRVTARAYVTEGEGGAIRVDRVAFRNVPSFVVELDARVEVPGVGSLRYDLAFGGAFYAYVDAGEAGVGTGPGDTGALIERGMAIKRAVMASRRIEHPFEADLGFLYGVIFVAVSEASEAQSRNVCVFAEGEVDRSPTGTGVSGRLAIHHARGEVATGDAIVVESITGSRFTGRVVEEVELGPHAAVIPEVEGSAWITGRQELVLDPRDAQGAGFLLR